jgi:hypothetical protein
MGHIGMVTARAAPEIDLAVVAAAHRIELTREHRLSDGGAVVEAHDLDVLDVERRERAILERAARDAHAQAAQVVGAGDGAVLRRDQHRGLPSIGDREGDLQGALWRDREDRDDQVHAVGEQRGDAAGRVHRHELDGDVHEAPERASDIHIDPLRLPARIEAAIRRHRGVDRDGEPPAADQLVHRLRGGLARHRTRERGTRRSGGA